MSNNYVPVSLLQKRRADLAKRLPNNALGLIQSATTQFRNHDIEYVFRQDSSFWYFSGIDQRDILLLIYKGADGVVEDKIYVTSQSREHRKWVGEQLVFEQIKQLSGVNSCLDEDSLILDVQKYFKSKPAVYVDLNIYTNHPLVEALVAAQLFVESPLSLTPFIQQLRMYKDSWELAQMQKAADISIAAHGHALAQFFKPHRYEYYVAADIEYVYAQHNCTWAYPSIVAGGKNACTLHYVANNQILNSGELCLVDAGCEYNYYASDITRTYPISGYYSEAQKRVYEIVLAAQKAAIAELYSPEATMRSYHQKAVEVLVQGLIDLDILKGSINEHIEKRSYHAYYNHGTGHFLGLDVHDLGVYKDSNNQPTPLKPGMVVTVEPGLYFAQDDLSVPLDFRGIGIRIEDDIVKTESGIINLTHALPKEVSEIESWMATFVL